MLGEIKDLFDITEEDFKKKEDSKKNKNILSKKEKLKKVKEEIKEDKKEKKIIKKENTNKSRKVKKYFKYKDGRVKYINFFSNKDKKVNIESVKEEVSNSFKVNGNRADKSRVLKNISIIIIIISILLTYFYYIRGADTKNEINQNSEINIEKNDNIDKEPIKDKRPKNNDENQSITNDEIVNLAKHYNAKEVEKVEKYINLKSNKVSTKSYIEKNKKEKEKLYISLQEIKDTISNEDFEKSENLLVMSIGMSKEFLMVFDENGGNKGLKNVIDKYTNN